MTMCAAVPLRIIHGLVSYLMSGKLRIVHSANAFRDPSLVRSQWFWQFFAIDLAVDGIIATS